MVLWLVDEERSRERKRQRWHHRSLWVILPACQVKKIEVYMENVTIEYILSITACQCLYILLTSCLTCPPPLPVLVLIYPVFIAYTHQVWWRQYTIESGRDWFCPHDQWLLSQNTWAWIPAPPTGSMTFLQLAYLSAILEFITSKMKWITMPTL